MDRRYFNLLKSIFIFSIFTLAANAANSSVVTTKTGVTKVRDKSSIPNSSPPFAGFSISPYIGKQIAHTKISNMYQAIIPNPINLNIMLPTTSDADHSSLLGGVALAYGFTAKEKYNLGIEARVGFEKIRAEAGLDIISTDNLTQLSDNTKMSIDRVYIFDIKPGVLLSNCTLLYALVGVAFVDVDVDTTGSYFQNVGFGAHSGSLANNQTVGRFGGIVGLGVEQFLGHRFSLKLEYDYVCYETILFGRLITAPVAGQISGSLLKVENNVIENQMNKIILGIVYHFS